MPLLRYLDEAGRLRTQTLSSDSFTIGRASSCQLVIESDTLSREHVRIQIEKDGRFSIRDLGSRNKTYVNGQLITETVLRGGDFIRAGDRVLEYLDDQEPGRLDDQFMTPDRSEPPHCEWTKTKVPLSLTLPQTQQLALLAGDVPIATRAEDIAGAALGHLLLALEADRGFIALRGEKKTELHPLAHRALDRSPSGARMPVSQTFALTPLLQSVAGRYPQTTGQLDAKLGYAVAAVAAPLLYQDDIIGVVYADRPSGKRPFRSDAVPMCLAAGAHIGTLVGEASARMVRHAPREAMAFLKSVRAMQHALATEVSSGDTFDVAHHTQPGTARCGDLVQVVHLDEQRCGVILVDGGGHGVIGLAQAAAIGTTIHTSIRMSLDTALDPADLFHTLSQRMTECPGRQVLPCLYVAVDLADGKLVYVNAGFPPPVLLVAPGRQVTLDQTSLCLGVDPGYAYEPTRIDVPECFRFLCYTDGVADAVNAGGDALGHGRIHDALLDHGAFQSVTTALHAVTAAWSTHTGGTNQDDDASVVVIGRG